MVNVAKWTLGILFDLIDRRPYLAADISSVMPQFPYRVNIRSLEFRAGEHGQT
ncbi:MAG: hypothetical protein ABSH09_24480 [Bryobacteraceae bacterium]|jgi:hypothetical protein